MKRTEDDFDESILEDEEAFRRRFRAIPRNERPNFLIAKALKESKRRITIYLDTDIIEHYKGKSEGTSVGYQTLINQTLRDSIVNTSPNDPIEKLLKDKKNLKRLKSELELV